MTDQAPDAGLTFSRALTVHTRAMTSADDLLTLARQRALDPGVLEQYPPFFWSGEASSTRWDAYDTKMGVSSLRNYAADATAGVAFLRNHDTRTDAIGGTLSGRFVGAQGDGVARLETDFYALSTPETEGYIAKIRGGVVRDLSIGFYGGEWLCSICGRDMQQWFGSDSCPHLLGMTYTPRDEAGTQKGQPEVARATIENARLAEVSGVYDGATPGAMIAKARSLAAEGQLSARTHDLVEVRYRIHLPLRDRRFAGATFPSAESKERARMADDETTPETAPADTEHTTLPVADETGEGATDARQDEKRSSDPSAPKFTPEEQLRQIREALLAGGHRTSESPLLCVRDLMAEVTRLRPLADDGRAYRTDLVAEALREGARAHGTEFAVETYRGVLETAPLETIKRMRDDWARAAGALFAGGRQTAEGGEPPVRSASAAGGNGLRDIPVPTAAYRG